ncbi:GvpL/GvpF family gas vesicle protein [Streptomyces sp. DSM 42041]|uniref:GvpL/GvpF family gas vesicle protein n=1 Tax=Streptomyces hazeniae TaxID=3075538 RepID=A0ABU2NYN3_9ACTN|nr:GvpL/GvpF family gas vesicle protein [Streptomyces sp. DSM 42041]MDT0382089.1 GvpL/GvpF family gas vesicle protein [Streptomyces sp. DSM 42041]
MSVYLYAVTAAGHPHRLDGLHGVGDPAGALRSLRARSVAAVVSDAPAELRAKRRDLMAHENVQERLLEDGAVLPMRFGLVAGSDDEVLAALDEHAAAYEQALREVEGCTEYHLRVARDEDDMLREIVTQSDEARKLNDRTRQDPASHADKVALGELISHEIERRRERAAEDVVHALSDTAVRHVVGQPNRDHLVALSFLVRRERSGDFSRAAQHLADDLGAGAQLTLHGPLPPYSFV